MTEAQAKLIHDQAIAGMELSDEGLKPLEKPDDLNKQPSTEPAGQEDEERPMSDEDFDRINEIAGRLQHSHIEDQVESPQSPKYKVKRSQTAEKFCNRTSETRRYPKREYNLSRPKKIGLSYTPQADRDAENRRVWRGK